LAKDEKLLDAVNAAVKSIDDKFGYDIKVLDISEISTLADYFIICTANNPNQIKAICTEAENTLYKHGVRLIHSEGMNAAAGGWVLLDFGSVVMHVFGKEEREFYNIERVWADAILVNS
jgi:ribosome-associated protein